MNREQPPHERWVRCSPEFVAQLLAEPSPPVLIIRIEERDNGELYFEAERHVCPSIDPNAEKEKG
jgi:hypothetical protein